MRIWVKAGDVRSGADRFGVRPRWAGGLAVLAAIVSCAPNPPEVVATRITSGSASGSASASPTAAINGDALQARLRTAAAAWQPPEESGVIGLAGGPAVEVGPGLSGSQVYRVVARGRESFERCYEKARAANAKLEGSVRATFTITKEGTVSELGTPVALSDQAATSCVRDTFAAMVFPKPALPVKVSFPVYFSASDVPPQPAKPSGRPSADGPWPIVELHGTSVLFDGVAAGDTSSLSEGRAKPIEQLKLVAREARKRWQDEHPGVAHPGVVGVRIEGEPSTHCRWRRAPSAHLRCRLRGALGCPRKRPAPPKRAGLLGLAWRGLAPEAEL